MYGALSAKQPIFCAAQASKPSPGELPLLLLPNSVQLDLVPLVCSADVVAHAVLRKTELNSRALLNRESGRPVPTSTLQCTREIGARWWHCKTHSRRPSDAHTPSTATVVGAVNTKLSMPRFEDDILPRHVRTTLDLLAKAAHIVLCRCPKHRQQRGYSVEAVFHHSVRSCNSSCELG